MLLSSFGLALLVFGLIEGQQYGWGTAIAISLGPVKLEIGGISVVPIAFVLSIVLLASLLKWERYRARRGSSVLINLTLFRIRRYGFGNIVALVVSLGEFGILFVLPLWLQSVAGFDPLTTGSLIAFLAVGTLAAGGSARHMSALMGPTKVVHWA